MIVDPKLNTFQYPFRCKAYVENGKKRRISPLVLDGLVADGHWINGLACGFYQSQVIFLGDDGETYIIEHSAQIK